MTPPPTSDRPETGVRGFLHGLLTREDGPTSVEYAVMLALIVTVIFASVAAVGGTTAGLFSSSLSSMQSHGM